MQSGNLMKIAINKQNQSRYKKGSIKMNASSLSPLKNKSILKQNSSTLPPINTPQPLKYHNDYQTYQDDLHQFKKKQNQEISPEDDSVSKNSSIFSSSLSSSRKSDALKKDPPKPSADLSNSIESKVQKSVKKIVPYEESPNFWNASQHKPHIQYSEKDEYKNKSVQEIQREIKSMRKQLQQMNHKLSNHLNEYNMAKSEFTPKELLQPSKSEFYQVQIETNKKVEQAQLAQIKKLNETELLIKDKDVLIDLENILIELRDQLHQGKKQEHDSRLKNHKQDLFLDEIIKTNSDNKDNNAVKLLKLQIIYYMKRQNSLKIYQQQLDHEEKLIRENDKNLEAKVQEIRKNHKNFHLYDDNYAKTLDKHNELSEKKKIIQKNLETIKKSTQISQEKLSRQILEIDTLIRKTVVPRIVAYEDTSEEIQNKINALTTAYQLNDSALKNIKYKFLQDEKTYAKNPSNQSKSFIKSTFKPTLRPKSKIQDSSFVTEIKQQNSKSIEKLPVSQRYTNDKNISMTIDVSLENEARLRSISEGLNNLKPKNFRILSKRQQNASQLDKHTSFSTLDYAPSSTKSIEKSIQIQTARFLKPNLLLSKAKNQR